MLSICPPGGWGMNWSVQGQPGDSTTKREEARAVMQVGEGGSWLDKAIAVEMVRPGWV